MSNEVDFLPWAVGSGANVTDQTTYAALTALLSGWSSGVASSAQINKAIRQGTVMASVLANFIANNANVSVLDNGDTATLLTNFGAALKAASSTAGFLNKSNNLSDLASIPTALGNLGLGNSGIVTGLPVGTPIPWPSSTPPAGFVSMVGQAISQTTYPQLYALYGTNLPDMRGYFIRGWAGAQTAIDSGRTLLSKEAGTGISVQLGGFTGYNGIDAENYETGNAHASYAVYTATTSLASTGATYKKIRPDNIAFNYICAAQ
jgi:hypothetical protein